MFKPCLKITEITQLEFSFSCVKNHYFYRYLLAFESDGHLSFKCHTYFWKDLWISQSRCQLWEFFSSIGNYVYFQCTHTFKNPIISPEYSKTQEERKAIKICASSLFKLNQFLNLYDFNHFLKLHGFFDESCSLILHYSSLYVKLLKNYFKSGLSLSMSLRLIL